MDAFTHHTICYILWLKHGISVLTIYSFIGYLTVLTDAIWT